MGAVKGAAERLLAPSPQQVAAATSDAQVKRLTEEAGGYGALGGTPRVDAVAEYLADSGAAEAPAGHQEAGAGAWAPGWRVPAACLLGWGGGAAGRRLAVLAVAGRALLLDRTVRIRCAK